MKISIIGGTGWVGKAVKNLFPEAYIYSRNIGTKDEVNKADIAFICVPTPNTGEGKLYTSYVGEAISWCKCPLIVVRSTVNPGDCDRWKILYNKRILFQPEYLGETPNHPLLDTLQTPFIIIGGDPSDRRELIELYVNVYNANVSIRQMNLYSAEIVKLSENRAIAYKVAQCQELYDVCENARQLFGKEVDYYEIREAIFGDDPRFNRWFSFIFPNKRGFNSKCIPKDIYAWCAWAESMGYEPKITKAILSKNKEWIKIK